MNSLRKWDGEVGEKAKALVRKWKQLLPDSENTSTSSSSTTSGSSSSSNATPVLNGIGESTGSHSHNHGQASHRKKKGGRLEEDGSKGAHVTHMPHKSSTRTMDGLALSSDHDDFSKALMMDTTTSAAASSSVRRTKEHIDSSGSMERGHSTEDTYRHKHKHKHKHSHKESPSKTGSGGLPVDGHHSKPPSLPAASTPKKPAMGVAPTISSLTRPKSPPIGSFLDTPPIIPGGSGSTYSPRGEADSSPAAVVNPRKRKGKKSCSVAFSEGCMRSRVLLMRLRKAVCTNCLTTQKHFFVYDENHTCIMRLNNNLVPRLLPVFQCYAQFFYA